MKQLLMTTFATVFASKINRVGKLARGVVLIAALVVVSAAVNAAETGTPDSYIPFVQSSGSQYIDTGVNAQSGTKAEIEFKPLSVPSSNVHLLGAFSGSTRVYFLAYGTGGFGYGYSTYSSAHATVTAGTRYTVVSVLEEGAQSFSTNGVVVATGTTTGTLNINRNLFLFGYNSSGTAAGLASARLYRCRIWQKDGNGDYQLVRDFKPCSKDYEACLYDEVNGMIYRSNGSSSFIGPLPWPDDSGASITNLTTAAYAQDGLVVNFDALRNAGANAPRDTSATNWVDLVSGRTATLKSLADDSILGCWTKNAYRFMGQSYFEFDEAYQIGDHYTVQVACDVWAPNSTNYNKGSFGVFGRSGGMYMQRLGTENTWDSYYFGQYGGAAVHRIQFINWDGKHLTMIRDGGNKAGTSLTTAYPAVTARGSHNGATVSGNAPAKRWMIGGWNPAAENLMNGSFHAVRIYNHALTRKEICQNWMVDNVRFHGLVPRWNTVLVQSSLPGAEGTEPCGVYAISASHAFTAPETATVGGNTYRCVGYTLEKFSSSTGFYTVWGAPTESSDRSYAFVHTDDTDDEAYNSVRLTWEWELIDGVEHYDASLYPQHGLVANFDGIRNAGATNAHDASAIVWRDVSGNGLHATNFVVDAALERGSWADGNGYRFVTNDQFRTSALLELGPQFTWQIATTLAADVSNAKYYRPFSSGDGKTVFRGRPYIEQSYFYCRSQAYGGWNWEGKYVNAFRDNTASGWTMGTATPAFQTFSFDQKTTGVNRWIIGGNGTTAEAFKGTVHSVRVYDRMLTAAELKNTREIDDIRFRGSVPATNTVFVATSLEGAEGDQECGIYRVAGTGHTFTATERRRIGGSGYAATRCIVETWNATSKMWENPVSSMGSTWTTPAVDSWPSRRITWYWSIPGMMIFVR